MWITTGVIIHFSNRTGESFKEGLWESWSVFISYTDRLQGQLERFRRVIKGKEAPVIDGLDGTLSLAAVLAVLASAESQRPIFL
jgi:predicted dehydrogenase